MRHIPSSLYSFTVPTSVMCTILYGPSQCVFSFPGCLKNLLSDNNTSPLNLNGLTRIWRSCHAFCLWFSIVWWNPTTKCSSSIWRSCNNLCSTTSPLVIFVSTSILRLDTMYSIGTIASCPYTSLNGVCPVSRLQIVQYAHITTDTFWSQSSRRTLHTLVNAFSRILLKASTVPFA